MKHHLDTIRSRLGPTPRNPAFIQRWRLEVRPPEWMPPDDPLAQVYRWQFDLLVAGQVVWGAMVQANSMLFEPGPYDHPAMAIYAPDQTFDACPDQLREIAEGLFDLKDTLPADPQSRRLAEMITDEMERGMGYRIPPAVTSGWPVVSTSVMVFRQHIPGGVLQAGWFPLLIHPHTPCVLIVPHIFWPRELVELWAEG